MTVSLLQTIAPALVIPLTRAFLCLDCDVVFPRATGDTTRANQLSPGCPTCQSPHVFPLASWLNRSATPATGSTTVLGFPARVTSDRWSPA